ncbi:MAG: alpha-ketoglutarate-dependent dioxygenase AlkB [Myxococcales bacterium]|nr:alpha-ketoglutarate-dependent dioxygenase AlkB [Myxococcales bacterium]
MSTITANLSLAPDLELLYLPDFIAAQAELLDALVAEVAWDERMRARRTACFGVPYAYSGIDYAARPLPPAIAGLCERAAEVLGERPNSALLNLYADGRSRMGFHRDAEDQLAPGTGVTVISLGCARTLAFRRDDPAGEEVGLRLAPGSLLHMPRASQRAWRHGVRREEGVGARISVTLRRLLPRAVGSQ